MPGSYADEGLGMPLHHRWDTLLIHGYVIVKGIRTVCHGRQSMAHMEFLKSIS